VQKHHSFSLNAGFRFAQHKDAPKTAFSAFGKGGSQPENPTASLLCGVSRKYRNTKIIFICALMNIVPSIHPTPKKVKANV
jgi:hypothetical protein